MHVLVMGETPAHLILFQFWCQQFCGTILGHNALFQEIYVEQVLDPASVEKGLCGS